MLAREERRLRQTFERVLVLCATLPVASAGCNGGVEVTRDPAGSDASDSDGPYMPAFPDGLAFDAYIEWCEAGPPQAVDATPCDELYYVPCGLPPGVFVTTDAGDLNRCDQLCVRAVGQVQGCEVTELADASDADSGATYAVSVDCTLCQPGRRPAGLRQTQAHSARGGAVAAYLAKAAHLEAASVPAFWTLRRELMELGAPRALVHAAERAARDEVRHARITARLARQRGGRPIAPRVLAPRKRSLQAIAIENVVEGCVRETYAALVAGWQAHHARDARIASAMKRIAADETRHAALAWAVSRSLERRLDPRARARLQKARRVAASRLDREAGLNPHPDLVRLAGLPTAATARRLVRELTTRLWT